MLCAHHYIYNYRKEEEIHTYINVKKQKEVAVRENCYLGRARLMALCRATSQTADVELEEGNSFVQVAVKQRWWHFWGELKVLHFLPGLANISNGPFFYEEGRVNQFGGYSRQHLLGAHRAASHEILRKAAWCSSGADSCWGIAAQRAVVFNCGELELGETGLDQESTSWKWSYLV